MINYLNKVAFGDCRATMREMIAAGVRVQCAVTSPPYWGLRKYCSDGDPNRAFEIGHEPTLNRWLLTMVEVFGLVRELLADDGVLWLNVGDAYATSGCRAHKFSGGNQAHPAAWSRERRASDAADTAGGSDLKPKQRLMLPARLALALQDDGWWLRDEIVWFKPNAMPVSIRDRTTPAHEMVYLFSKRPRYFFDADAISEPASRHTMKRISQRTLYQQPGGFKQDAYESGITGARSRSRRPADILRSMADRVNDGELQLRRNKRSVWHIPTQPFADAHFATFPEALIEPMILAGTSARGHCPHCGLRWSKLMEKGSPDRDWQRACGGDVNGEYHGVATKDYAAHGAQNAAAVKANILAGMRERRIVGWTPSCGCDVESVPDVVFDPFMGSGTVASVAQRLGRHSIGCELNVSYQPMQDDRTREVGLAL